MFKDTAWYILTALMIVLCFPVPAEPATVADPHFPLISMPEAYRSQRYNSAQKTPAGQSFDIFNAKGPGCVKYIWLLNYPQVPECLIEIRVDDAPQPQVRMNMRPFFGVLLDQYTYRLESPMIEVCPMSTGDLTGQTGYSMRFPIPFQHACRISVTPLGEEQSIAAYVDWQQYPADTKISGYRFHAVHSRQFPATTLPDNARVLFPMANISGSGFVAAIFKGLRQRDQSDMIYHTSGQFWLIDGETDPHFIRGKNEEDDFGGFWGYQEEMRHWFGSPYHRWRGRHDQEGVIFRFFAADAIRFQSSLSLKCGARADDTESVVYYYRKVDSQAPAVRTPACWQSTGTFPCNRDWDAFERSEFPERLKAPWPDAFENFQVHTIQTDHTWLNLWPHYRQGTEAQTEVSAYARAAITADRNEKVILRLGYDDWMMVWLNGKKLQALRQDDNEFVIARIPAKLKKGENELLIKTANFNGPRQDHRLFAFSCVVE
jgi:hypothetical protein